MAYAYEFSIGNDTLLPSSLPCRNDNFCIPLVLVEHNEVNKPSRIAFALLLLKKILSKSQINMVFFFYLIWKP